MGTSSERVFNGSGKGYLPAGTMGNRTHILSERLKAATEFKRLKKGHRPAPMPPTWTHILSYKPHKVGREFRTQRRPLNVAFVLRRTVEQATLCLAPSPGPTCFKPQLRQRNTAKPAPTHARASAIEANKRIKRLRRNGTLVAHNDAAANVDAHVAIDQARYAGAAMR